MKLPRPLFILAFCLPAFLPACRSSVDGDRPPGALVVALEAGPTHLDPRYAIDADSERISALVFNALVRPDKNSRLEPELAESWTAIDERTYMFRIRKGVFFHDGKPLTAADVKYTYESVLDPANHSPKRGALGFLEIGRASCRERV